jgi:hypothetical protein
MRRWLAMGGVAVALGAAPTVALAVAPSDGGGGTSPVNCQATRWTSTVVPATSRFAPIKALTTHVESIFPMTVTVSGFVKGVPVQFKVVDHGIVTQTAKPGIVSLSWVGENVTPFSFTWVAPGSPAAVHEHTITVDLRRATATGFSMFGDADVVVTYRTDNCPRSG